VSEPTKPPPLESLWPRFSLRGLLVGMGAIAALIPLAGFLLRNASNWIGSFAFLIGSLLLAATVCMALNRTGAKRAFWTGCAVFGITYFVIAGDPWSQPYTYELITSTISEIAYERYYLDEDPLPATTTELTAADSVLATPDSRTEATATANERPSLRDFVMISQLFWTMLVAILGGWISVFMYWTGLPK
jgi:hypothetical protein